MKPTNKNIEQFDIWYGKREETGRYFTENYRKEWNHLSGKHMIEKRFKPKEFIAIKEWHFAKTMPENPHEYCLRRETEETEFEEFVKLIRKEGYQELYEGRMYICYNVEQHKYWTMGEPIEKTILINRAKLSEDED